MAHGKPLLFIIGASHLTASTQLRERLYLSEEQLSSLLPQVKEHFGFSELVALSTCNRFEMFGLVEDHSDYATQVYKAFLDLHRPPHDHDANHYSEDEVRNSLYLYIGNVAIEHIFKVASSLDSLVLGETQITGQFKDAVSLATRSKTIGPTLNRLCQEALATAKKVRNQTDIGKKTVSISHAAIELAQKVYGHLGDHRFLIIGAGEMSQVAAKYVLSYKPKTLMIANRTLSKAQEITNEIGFGEAFQLDELPELLMRSDVVLSSTAAPGIIIDRAMVERAQGSRRGRPLVMLDIALPRDIDSDVGKLEDVYLFDIDDLKQVVGANLDERRKAASDAGILVEKSVLQFESWLRTLSVKPAIASFRFYLEDTIKKEVNKTLAKEIFKTSPRHVESVEALAAAIIGKIAADAAKTLTTPPEGFIAEDLAESLEKFFPKPTQPLLVLENNPPAETDPVEHKKEKVP